MRLLSIRKTSAKARRTSASFPSAAVWQVPMRCHRISGPPRGKLVRGAFTDAEDEIKGRSGGFNEAKTALWPQSAHIKAHS